MTPNENGMRARCGGPSICAQCATEWVRAHQTTTVCPHVFADGERCMLVQCIPHTHEDRSDANVAILPSATWDDRPRAEVSEPPKIELPDDDALLQDGIKLVVEGIERVAAWMHATARQVATMAQPCPVCAGTGRVPHDFYGETRNNSALIICQSCRGAGIVWRPHA